MVRLRKAEALFQYAIIITVVALGLATMHIYLRRSIQAKVKDLTDKVIYDKQLASLNDPVSEKSTRDISSTYNLQKVESTGGVVSLSTESAYTVQMEHEVESVEKIDYGQTVLGVDDSLGDYIGYGGAGATQGSIGDADSRDSGGGILTFGGGD